MRYNNSGFFITALAALFAAAAKADGNLTNATNNTNPHNVINPISPINNISNTNDSDNATNYTGTDPTRIESYSVNTTIESRFARTYVAVDFVNERDCATIRGFTFQLPRDARVTRLVMSGSNGCTLDSTVKEQQQAEEEFHNTANQGKPAALLTAYDSTNYAVEVSLPPLGKTRVDFTFEQLLVRKSHQVPFQIPIFPGVPVERLQMDITVREPQTGVATFYMEDNVEVGDIATTLSETVATAHYERNNLATENALPRLLRGYYDSGPLPTNGMLISDRSGSCLVHLFNPDSFLESTGSLPRDIVFVIDVSGSMSGQKLDDAKDAFAAIVQKLSGEDYFTIHTFSNNGIEDMWGPDQASEESKGSASRFVQSLETIGGTNLNDAYVDGVKKVENMHDSRKDGSSQYALPIVMMLSDGEGSLPGSEVARNVRNANEGVGAKIYNLAFGFGADIDLLTGISIQNGGVTAQIYEGFGDAVTQMENFYVGELGAILMSDIDVSFDGTLGIDSHTQLLHSVLADGSEIAVRAKTIPQATADADPARTIRATTIANTLQGTSTWQTDLQLDVSPTENEDSSSNECLQSYSHAKVREILMFRDAARSLGDEMDYFAPAYLTHDGILPPTGSQAQVRSSNRTNFVEIAEAQALVIALEAGVVWPGLTALVTVSNSVCESLHNNDTEVCFDGDGSDNSFHNDIEMDGMASAGGMSHMGASYGSGASGANPVTHAYSLILSIAVAIVVMMMIDAQ